MGPSNDCYRFGPYTVNARERMLLRHKETVPVTPKAFDILLVLIRRAGRLIEKAELMKEIWGDTYVEESNLTQNISTLRKLLGERLDGGEYIETVPRRGYRFIAAVNPIADAEFGGPRDEGKTIHQSNPGFNSLAVLPFLNSSTDSDIDYLSESIPGSIISRLSKLSDLRVMSGNTVCRYKGRNTLNAQLIGKELGVNNVLVGRIDSIAKGLLVSIELVDVAEGWHLWGNNYVCGFQDIVEASDQIAKEISAVVPNRISLEKEK